jgi:hypothetical protein
VLIEVWGNNIEDRDIISLFINNVCVLDKYTLTKEKKTVKNQSLKTVKIIIMLAKNFGNIFPNTSHKHSRKWGIFIRFYLNRT